MHSKILSIVVLSSGLLFSGSALAEKFNFQEYKDVPWGDIIINGGESYFCYGFPPQMGVSPNAKCLRIDNQDFKRCTVSGAFKCELGV